MNRRPQGAALVMALLVLALVTTLVSSAVALQWRQTETEIAERERQQMRWLMSGAIDWVGLVLSEDARSSAAVDHLGEPWALPLARSRLSTFLAPQQQWREGDPEVFLSGRIEDAQARLNLRNLQRGDRVDPQALAALRRLFELLKLPESELPLLLAPWTASGPNATALQAQRPQELAALGLTPSTWQALAPHVVVLPQATPVNLNTASEWVLRAVLPQADPGRVRQALLGRARQPWRDLQEAAQALGSATPLDSRWHAVNTQHFWLQGQLSLGQSTWSETALLQRQGRQVHVVWRQAGLLQ